MSIAQIDANPWQPRREFPLTELDELVASIREHGLLQPITVRPHGPRFQLVAGERRLRACRQLGWTTIPALEIAASDRDMLEWAIIENLQRAELGPIDTALALRRLINEFTLTQEQVAQRLGQSRSHVANTLRLLELPERVRDLVSRGSVNAGAARALLALRSVERQVAVADRIAKGELTVRDVEREVQRDSSRKETAGRRKDANLAQIGEDLQERLGLKVSVTGTVERGKVSIEFYSKDDLNQLYERLMTRETTRAARAT